MFSSIGQFSKLTGVTAKALYLYERRGLLTPRRSRAGYRRYTMRELTQLERIVALKGLGLSLQQIAAMTRDEGRATGLLQQQRAVLDDKRRRLERAVNAIDAIAGDEMPGAALERFVNESSWDRWEVRLKAAASQAPRAPDRASPSRVALFQKIHAALDRDPRGRKARELVGEWNALLAREFGRDSNMAESKRQRWAGRQSWPAGMRNYVASLYDMEWPAWDRVAAFIDAVMLKLPPQKRPSWRN
ncbi:MAG TPA: MerR family transcriptional regulator [Vicinamibacterales bacterium]|nr:MerR family transcriptional regulator [Vicinamibacterales bacterium]